MAMRAGWIFWAAAILAVGFTMAPDSAFGGEAAGWDLLQQGGFVVLIRHAEAPGFGDPPHFRLEDCATQRNLSEDGRRQARSIGEAFRRRKIPIEKVYSSQWCRSKDTAELAFGEFQPHPALNSFFEEPYREAAQTAEMQALILQSRPRRGNLILVTHQVNITALTDIVPSPGELVAVAFEGSDGLVFRFRLTPSD